MTQVEDRLRPIPAEVATGSADPRGAVPPPPENPASAVVESTPPRLPIPAVVRRNTFLFAVTQALVGIGSQLTPTLGPIMVMSLTGSAALAGLGTSVLGGSKFVIAYPIGYVTDRFGRKAGLFLGLSLSLMGSLLIGLSALLASFSLFLLGISLFGLGVGATQQLRLAAADMYPPARRAEGVGFVLTGSLLGALGGPVLVSGAQLIARAQGLDSIALTWFLVPVVILPSMALVFLVRPDPKEIAANLGSYYPGYVPAAPRVGRVAPVAFREFISRMPTRTAFVASFAVHGNMSMMMAMTSLALAHHGHELAAISLSVALHVIGMFGFSLPIGRLTDGLGRRKVMLGGLLIAFLGSLLVPMTAMYWTITAGTFLVGLGWSCVNVAASALIADTTDPDVRGRAIGTNDTFSGASSIVLPLLAGPIVAFVGLPALTVVSLVLMLPPLVLLLRLREPRPGRYLEQPAER